MVTYLRVECGDHLVRSLHRRTGAYRKFYALFSLLVFSFMSTVTFISLLSTNYYNDLGISLFVNLTLLGVLFLIKTPTYPFSVWLPEAHVEGSFLGSVSLAAFGMKFSIFGIILFCVLDVSLCEILLLLSFLGTWTGCLSLSGSSDFKRVSACLSIFHL